VCEQDYLHRFRFDGRDTTFMTCPECHALFERADQAAEAKCIGVFDRIEDGRRYPEGVIWLDLLFGVGEILRLRGEPSVVGVITGLADRDGRAYDVEFLNERGETTYSGRMSADRFYKEGSEVWERRYRERLVKADRTPPVDLP
jgi:hypothetical protein